jgi:hypothetical protein
MTTVPKSIGELIEAIASGTPAPVPSGQLEAELHLLTELLQQSGGRDDGAAAGFSGPASAARTDDQARLISSLRTMLEAREAEIVALKNGGEIASFRRYIAGFIRAHQAAVTATAAGGASNASLILVRDLVADALDACGVETFTPRVGADYRREEGVADKPELIPAPSPDRAFQIASVITDGYRREKADGFDILVPAKVRVYTTQQDK